MSEQIRSGGPGDSAKLVELIKEQSDDIEKVVIPQHPTIYVVDPLQPGKPGTHVEAGMVLHLITGVRRILTPVDAELILNDGILNRMRIKIELFR